jgi:hypothetical protein
MLLIYSTSISPRLLYIIDFISKELFDEQMRITSNVAEFNESNGFKLNYSKDNLLNAFQLEPAALLFETSISEQNIDTFSFGNSKAIFKTNGDFPFDIFAAAFFLLSRYEEYLPHKKDEYGRYAHINSIAYRQNFLQLPMINVWLVAFKRSVQNKFPAINFKHQQFSCNITYDIDIAYSFKHKGFIRTTAGFVRSILKGNLSEVKSRWLVLAGKQQDPFDCYEWLDALHLYCRLKPFYFFLVARKQIGYDKNISTGVKQFRQLIEYYAKTYDVGIHPSWQTGDHPALLKEELEWLQVVADKKIQSSRQHYIRFTLPETYRELIKAGIKKDFSMGYGSTNGFRASVCSTFLWYDLSAEKCTDLTIHPFCFMDSNAFYEANQTPQQTYLELLEYYETTKKVNGNFTAIWHNHLLGTDPNCHGWREMFELFMKETVYWDAYSDKLPGSLHSDNPV